MNIRHERARALRRNMTEPEHRLWNALKQRQLGVKFRRQFPAGPYILDFYCHEKRLGVEVDGDTHGHDDSDQIRDDWLRRRGFKVLRFWNHEVMQNLDGVLQVIEDALRAVV